MKWYETGKKLNRFPSLACEDHMVIILIITTQIFYLCQDTFIHKYHFDRFYYTLVEEQSNIIHNMICFKIS